MGGSRVGSCLSKVMTQDHSTMGKVYGEELDCFVLAIQDSETNFGVRNWTWHLPRAHPSRTETAPRELQGNRGIKLAQANTKSMKLLAASESIMALTLVHLLLTRKITGTQGFYSPASPEHCGGRSGQVACK